MSLCVFFPVLFKRDGICITDQLLMQIQKSFVISQQFFHLFGANDEATNEESRDGKTKKQKPKIKKSHPENSSSSSVETLPGNDSRLATDDVSRVRKSGRVRALRNGQRNEGESQFICSRW